MEEEKISSVEKAAIKITKWIGTPASIIVHTILFIAAFSMTKFGYSLDSMLLMLTTIVSLEAIYLGLFVQMTVNRQEKRLCLLRIKPRTMPLLKFLLAIKCAIVLRLP